MCDEVSVALTRVNDIQPTSMYPENVKDRWQDGRLFKDKKKYKKKSWKKFKRKTISEFNFGTFKNYSNNNNSSKFFSLCLAKKFERKRRKKKKISHLFSKR